MSSSEKNYVTTELETSAIAWKIAHFWYHLYDHKVMVYTNHSAVKAILCASLNEKHTRWWNKVHSRWIQELHIVYWVKQNNCQSDTLSRLPILPFPVEDESRALKSTGGINLQQKWCKYWPYFTSTNYHRCLSEFFWWTLEWRFVAANDIVIKLPQDDSIAQKIVTESVLLTLTDNILGQSLSRCPK